MDEEQKEEDVENMDSGSFEDENMAGVSYPGASLLSRGTISSSE